MLSFRIPQKKKSDKVKEIIKNAVSSFGGPPIAFFASFYTPPYQKRLGEWMEKIGEALQRLEDERSFNLDKLQNNDQFIDILMYGSQIALRTSKEEKRKALRNAILNSALPDPPEEALQQMFLNFIDEFTEWHIRILKLVDDPAEWCTTHSVSLPTEIRRGLLDLIEVAYTNLVGQDDMCKIIWVDLHRKGLVHIEYMDDPTFFSNIEVSRTTSIGKQFLNFIEDPLES